MICPCPICHKEAQKAIYYAFPVKLCFDCNVMFGFFSWIALILPYSEIFFVYKGSYLKALWLWLTSKPEDQE